MWNRNTSSRRHFNIAERCFILIVIFLFQWTGTAALEAKDLSFDKLQKRLIRAGFNAESIHEIYAHPNVSFEIDGVSRFFIHSEARINYDQFLSRDSIRKARQYMRSYQKELSQTEKAFGVEKEIITAVILVETRLGTYLGSVSILNSLSTMAALSDAGYRNIFWQKISSSNRVSKREYEKKAREKSKWAYDELKAYLSFADKEGFNPVNVKGSYAGAMGIAQFMPSNILKLAVDGNNDGHIDLFNHADAMMSIANYLKHNKWRLGMKKEKAYQVLLSYNYSKPYADTLLKIADRLRN